MYRHGSYEEKLAEELKDPEFARGFLRTLMEGDDGLPLIDALRHTIRRMGVKEFSEISGIHEKSISRMLSSKKISKIETLDKYCAPFGLMVGVYLEGCGIVTGSANGIHLKVHENMAFP